MHAVDTSLAVPLLMTTHPAHESVEAWAQGRELSLGPRATLETYAVLTRLPGTNRLLPADAATLIESNFTLTAQEPIPTSQLASTLATASVAGGASYDGVIGLEALTAGLPLASRDARAGSTYARIGAKVEMLD
ncbi:VapC toxin family PIN domain ribonuclease [Ornithinimicrobium tianjinense]|uniref:Ribonuclease VapC n=1 Tax=Ornithinimicrobium tianjinense TaxID=1195761 RepID=A0A917BGD0_9MICO|nr:VapC toxin family PIN domain ribonuclease [Ornithinimicrobium tianjinense]GGF43398.1 ribonuclease VapC [Ornithinimicrobium tianjinense]